MPECRISHFEFLKFSGNCIPDSQYAGPETCHFVRASRKDSALHCSNRHNMPFLVLKSQFFSGGSTAPLPDSAPVGMGYPLPTLHPSAGSAPPTSNYFQRPCVISRHICPRRQVNSVQCICTLQCAIVPSNLALSVEDLDPHLIHDSLDTHELARQTVSPSVPSFLHSVLLC